MSAVIDFHSHILCGVDHGSKSIDESLSQLLMMTSFGTEFAVATSHFYPEMHNVNDFCAAVEDAVALISNAYSGSKELELCIGAEVLICCGMETMEGLDRLCIRGTNVLLLEMPFAQSWSRELTDSVERIIDRGYTVVLAHIDRYLDDHEQDIDSLLALGAKAQVNSSSLARFAQRRKLLPYIDGGYVYALGSDLHGVDRKCYKKFAAVAHKIGEARFDSVMRKTEKLLEGAERIKLGN